MIVYKNMNFLQGIIGLLVLIGLVVIGFFVFWALLPIILILVAYIWYKIWRMKKAFRAAQENMNDPNNPYQSITYIYTDSNGQTYSSEEKRQESSSTPIYDIKPEDYKIEDNK